MDLSLIRKLILSRHIRNYEGVLKQVHLIGHNCVKYNGRESDYALVTREFESVATEYVWTAVNREARGGGRGNNSRTTSPMTGATATGAGAGTGAVAVANPSAVVTAIGAAASNAATSTGGTAATKQATPKTAVAGNVGITQEGGAIHA